MDPLADSAEATVTAMVLELPTRILLPAYTKKLSFKYEI